MRVLPILAVTIALALAGCARNDDGGGTTTTTTTATTTPTGTTTTTTPTGTTTPTSTTPTTPTKPAPMELGKGTVDFSNPAGITGAPKTYTVPAGYTMVNLTVTWSCVQGLPECLTQSATIKAAGLNCDLAAGAFGTSTAFPKCAKEGPVAAGDIKLEATGGPGAVQGAFVINIS